jgi:hypothetical protein
MAIPQWPSTLPQAGRANVSGGIQRNVVSFQPDIGPSIDRRRASSAGRIRDVELFNVTKLQYETFLSFFEVDLYDGILPFTWIDPITELTSKVKFVQNDPVFRETKLMPDQYEIAFQLFVMRS